MATQRVRNKTTVVPGHLPSNQCQNAEEFIASLDPIATTRNSASSTDLSLHSELHSRPTLHGERARQDGALQEGHSGPTQRYHIDKSSLRMRKRAWQDEQNDLNRVLDEERQAWSKRSHKDLRTQYNTCQNGQPVERNDESRVETYAAPDDEDISAQSLPQRRSNFLEGSMNELSRGTASTWQAPVLKEPSTPRVGTDEDSDMDATPRPSDIDQASARSSFDINDFKPLPPTPSTLASTLKRFGQRFKAIDTKQNSLQISTSDVKTLKNPRKGLRKSLSSWKIFSSSASETSDMESDCVDYDKECSKSSVEGTHNNHKQSILDERKRKAEIAYAEQFGTSKKRHKDNLGHGRITGDQTWSDTEQTTIRKRSGMSVSNLKGISTAVPLHQPSEATEILHTPLDRSSKEPGMYACQPESISHLRSLPRKSSLNFDSDIDRTKRRRRSYSALEKENQYLRQQLRESESREATTRGSHLRRKSNNSVTTISALPNSVTSDKSRDSVKGQRQDVQHQCTTSSSDHQHSTEACNIRHTSAVQNKASQNSPGIAASELTQIIRQTLPMPSPVQMPANRNVLSPVSPNTSYSRDLKTIKYRPMVSSVKEDITFEIPRSLSMVLEGNEEDEDGELSENIGNSTVTKSGNTGRRKLGQVVESESRMVEGKWEWPEDVF